MQEEETESVLLGHLDIGNVSSKPQILNIFCKKHLVDIMNIITPSGAKVRMLQSRKWVQRIWSGIMWETNYELKSSITKDNLFEKKKVLKQIPDLSLK